MKRKYILLWSPLRCHIAIGFLCLLFALSILPMQAAAQKVEKNDYFYILSTEQGLADNHILQMMQLPDGRMVVETAKGANIYDGKRFHSIPLSTADAQPINLYEGQIHLYVDRHKLLWIKNTHQVFCIDLKTNRIIRNPLAKDVEDMFVDSDGDVWCNTGKGILSNRDNGRTLAIKDDWGALQDLDVENGTVYTFHANGIVAAYPHANKQTAYPLANKQTASSPEQAAYTLRAYDKEKTPLYNSTSLVVKTPGGQFYQIKTGYDDKAKKQTSIFLHFDPRLKHYEQIFNCDYILHTLNMSSDSQALISTQQGYLMFDFKVGNTPREVHELALPDGKSLTTGINTVYKDQDGGIWLGTYNDGLIYVSPMLGLFFTIDKPWWQTGWGIVGIILVVGIAALAILAIGKKRTKLILAKEKATGQNYNMKEIDASEVEPSKVQPSESEAPEVLPSESKSSNVLPSESEPSESKPSEPEFIQKVRTLVEQHIKESEYGVEQLATDLCMERTGLYKKLTSMTSTTPVAFIRNIRLHRAAQLLKEQRMSVNEIAEATGFSSPSYFTKCFKKEFGMLPSEYSNG